MAGAGSQNSAVVPMGSEEVSALANAIAAHTANFLAMTGVALAQRGLFAAQVGTGVATYAASDALAANPLTL